MAQGYKTGGRQRGTPNKSTQVMRERIKTFLDCYTPEQMQSDFLELKPDERLRVFSSLVEFITPKIQRQIIEQGDDEGKIIVVVREEAAPFKNV